VRDSCAHSLQRALKRKDVVPVVDDPTEFAFRIPTPQSMGCIHCAPGDDDEATHTGGVNCSMSGSDKPVR